MARAFGDPRRGFEFVEGTGFPTAEMVVGKGVEIGFQLILANGAKRGWQAGLRVDGGRVRRAAGGEDE